MARPAPAGPASVGSGWPPLVKSLGFNFRLLRADFDAAEIRGWIENSLAAVAIEGATPTWTLANHDVKREVTRYGGGRIGLARAWAMALVMLALPGAVFIYNG